MEKEKDREISKRKKVTDKIRLWFSHVPFIGWLLGCLLAVVVEQIFGSMVASMIGLPKIPALFGFVIILKEPFLTPSAIIYVLIIYLLPVFLIARFGSAWLNALARKLLSLPGWMTTLLYLLLMYGILHIWSDISAYRVLTMKLMMIAVILTLSLNVINGYMGEFSCSHPGFMAIGAYVSSALTVMLFADDKLFGPALLPPALGPYLFPLALIAGGAAASIGALVIAIPSFRTRGDYLAIISLAFMFIVKSIIENLEVVGGPRGMGSQPDYANLPTVFIWTVACIWIINNFVTSTRGKALNAIRDDELAAEAMTVNTRQTKMTAFLFSAFWAGVAGGLFAHVLRYVNPGTFGIQKLAEVLAMVYFGGLNSVYGSIFGAVSLSLLEEFLRPLELFKWIIIPLLLIFVMIYRPTGLIAFREFNFQKMIQPRKTPDKEV
ncbi:MAG: branched-chain amino acid ABC transporter permease [Desulfobacteraceae bacterium]|nr:MAG: branched-chain amino acid ABC transporter permease [Desulfobacteraceae bacterium]